MCVCVRVCPILRNTLRNVLRNRLRNRLRNLGGSRAPAPLRGAVLGGLIIGLAEACVPADLSGYRDVVAYGFLFVVLLVRPQGLLGRVLPTKV